METIKKPVTLVCTLGTTATVLSETLELLLDQGESITRMIIFHTTAAQVFKKQTYPNKKEIGLDAFKEFMNKTYPEVDLVFHSLGIEDIFTDEDNRSMMSSMIAAIRKERMNGSEVIVSIAGGRKTMSAIGLMASCLTDVKAVYHVVGLEDENRLSDTYGFSVPLDKIRLIQAPVIRVGDLLTPLCEWARIESLEKEDIFSVMDRLNDMMADSLRLQAFYRRFHEIIHDYRDMAESVKSIIERSLKTAGIRFDAVHARTKKFESFIEKANRVLPDGKFKYSDPFAQIEDFAGVRPVLYYQSDIDKACKLISNEFEVLEEHSKTPDPMSMRGYESVHMMVRFSPERLKLTEYSRFNNLKCEIQVRTIFDHTWAQIDHQLCYKQPPERREKIGTALYGQKLGLDAAKNFLDSLMQSLKKDDE